MSKIYSIGGIFLTLILIFMLWNVVTRSTNERTAPYQTRGCPECETKTTLQIYTDSPLSHNVEGLTKTNVVSYAYEFTPEEFYEALFTEHTVGHIALSPNEVLRQSTSLEDLKKKLVADKVSTVATQVVARGGVVEIIIANSMPRWLSSRPDDFGNIFSGQNDAEKIWHSTAPNDYEVYQQFVSTIVDHFSNQLNLKHNVIYTFGSEPDNYFVGNESEFLKMYKYFTTGVRQADPDAKVGGPAPASYRASNFSKAVISNRSGLDVEYVSEPTTDGDPIIKNFIEYASANKLPLDYIIYHQYPAPSPIPADTAIWVTAEKEMRTWLNKNGFHKTSIILNDWPEWQGNEKYDTEYMAAWTAASLASIVKYTNYTVPVYLGLRDLSAFSAQNNQTGFVGATGMVTAQGIKKPVYNFYQMVSKMEGALVNVDSDDAFVSGFATVNDQGVQVLASYFVPDENLLLHNSHGIDLDDATRSKLALRMKEANVEMNIENIRQRIMNGSITAADLGIEGTDLGLKLEEVIQFTRSAMYRKETAVETMIKIDTLAPGTWRVKQYVIDEQHANSFYYKDDITKALAKVSQKPSRADVVKTVRDINEKSSLEQGLVMDQTIEVDATGLHLPIMFKPNTVTLLEFTRDEVK